MQKNDIIELKIEDMGVDGEGIGKYDGMTFFVKDAVLGDEIEARITKMKKNYGYARVEQILSPSKFRVTPQCELHRRCGGCQIQALDYEKQLEFKQNKVRGNLIRIGGFAPELIDRIMFPVVGMKEPYRYRNKAQFPIGADKDGNPVAGFYAARTHSIIPVNDCKLGVEENQIILNEVLSYMKECHVASYDENTGKGLVRHVLIRYGFSTKELMVCVIINGNSLPKVEKLIDRLTAIEGMKSISINQNTKKTNVILGDVTKCIWGDPYITDMIHLRDTKDFSLTDTAVAYHISPQSFYQVNPVQTEKLYSLNPVNTPIAPHSKALFSLETYKFFLNHLHIEPNVPLAHFPKMNHNVDSQNYVSNIRMRTVIYRANYLMLLLPSYMLCFFYFQIPHLILTSYPFD